jgi:hypothetical protein
MAEQYYEYDDDEPGQGGGGHLFLWTVFILLLIGAAFAAWIGSFYIFGHPEKPRPYSILLKLKKIEPPKRFEVTQAPTGEFLNPKKLFEKYGNMKTLELQQENDALLRAFIKNYKETKKLVPYVTGRFEVVATYELDKNTRFGTGVVALAVSDENPQVLLEQVFTTSPGYVATCRAALPVGRVLRIERTKDLSAIIHVERTSTGHLQFTTMPIAYAGWRVTDSPVVISLEPPPAPLNVAAGLPIVRGDRLQTGLNQFAQLMRTRPIKPAAAEEDKDKPSTPELVRLDTKPGTQVPDVGPMPDSAHPSGAIAVATPKPKSEPFKLPFGLGEKKTAVASPTPMVVASIATPPPRPVVATPMPVATPISVATPLPKRGPGGIELKPFMMSVPQQPAETGSWKTYAPGKLPAGKVVTPGEAGDLAQRGELVNGRFYLRGNFIVTASNEGRAVLRAQGPKTETGGARVMVEFPPSVTPPSEGSTFARDESRPFEVRDVRRGADGLLNIWVREVTVAPQ